MSSAVVQQDYDKIVEIRDALEPPNAPTRKKSTLAVTKAQAQEQVKQRISHWKPPLDIPFRDWDLVNQEMWSWSPIQLFMHFFGCVLALLLFHTNQAVLADAEHEKTPKPFTEVELRRWIAIRLTMRKSIATDAYKRKLWEQRHPVTKDLSEHRYDAIEKYLCLSNDTERPSEDSPWYWKIERGVEAIRNVCRSSIVPGSHFAVDEVCVECHGKCCHKYKVDHKPAEEAIVLYSLCAYEGMLIDFLMTSSQEGIEDDKDGVTVSISARATRARARGMTGATATEIHLPPTKSVVYILCERLRERFPLLDFTVWIDNLFADVHLAKALLSQRIGCTGTLRKDAKGVPPVLAAIKARFGSLLAPNQMTTRIIDDAVCVGVWHDHLRGKKVSLVSTVHSPASRDIAY